MPGEIKLISLNFDTIEAKIAPAKGLDIGAGINEVLTTKIYGGVVGIILDGRGRQPFILPNDSQDRIENLLKWSKSTQEFPELEVK